MNEKDLSVIVRLAAGGASLREIQSQSGISKSTIAMYLNRLKDLKMDFIEAIKIAPAVLLEKLSMNRSVNEGYYPPDYEASYIRHHHRGRHRTTLKEIWQDYVDSVPDGLKAIGYQAFCKGFVGFCSELPASLQELSMTNQWDPGDVAMIDYSGDGLYVASPTDGKKTTVQIFVAVLAYSGYIFCCATPRQTRDDWLDAQIKMLNFFGGVPRQIFLDNSTSLVIKADKVNPKLCNDYIGFCDYYGTTAVAVRPYQARDKAAVENAVKQVQNTIINALLPRTFFSIEDLNKEILKKLEKLNGRALTTRNDGASRLTFFEEEKPMLLPLPPLQYEPSLIKKILKVQRNYLIRYNNRRYSVPAAYVGKKVLVLIWPRRGRLEVFDIRTGERIAGHYLTIEGSDTRIYPQHMPQTHRAMLITREQLLTRMAQCGDNTSKLACEVAKHSPGETGRKLLRSMDGLRQALGNDNFELCCQKTLMRPVHSYQSLLEIIDELIGKKETKTILLGHGSRMEVADSTKNVRGPDYYKQIINTLRKQEEEQSK